MNYTDDHLKKIEEYAADLMRIGDIATLLDLDEDELREDIRDNKSPAGKSYRKGKIATILQLHKQELELARLGSPIAMEATKKYMLDQQLSEDE